MKKEQLNKAELSSDVEIDADLAEILRLLASMLSKVDDKVSYLDDHCESIRLLTGSEQVGVWLAFERGSDIMLVQGGLSLDQRISPNAAPPLPTAQFFEAICQQESYQEFEAKDFSGELGNLAQKRMLFVPVLSQDSRMGILWLTKAADGQFADHELNGVKAAALSIQAFLLNSDLLDSLKTLFFDLDFMIQEWIKDVSERLETVQQSERLLGKILSDLSHEFRTPIASLRLYSGLIQKRPEKSQKYLQTMQLELSRLEQILEGILILSEFRLFSGKNPLVKIDLTSFFSRYQDSLAGMLNTEQTFIYDVKLANGAVLADENYLFEALRQLVTNAIAYGGKNVQIRLEREIDIDLDSEILVIRVVDDGRGISIEDAPHIFNPFYRGEGVGQSTIFGAGLGLTYAREIIHSFGGALTLAPSSAAGTTMEIRLPILVE